ncbi:MAG: pseudouridine synthase [Clostridium sp.]|uniref:pseudouridine synthase n=1 Tax=Clostridium sp. TaxID=1506 RepID=UPI0025C5B709|nr:pseudouridine synthase [Clostridium sp.]MCI6691721.1 pseudouridine synthase [Clostridium sp.]MDY4252545.1 pseudouridine synthase [Clostridium sp.]MDY6228261.1 pseudouridine synthase [Clostridium sp.]
MRINKLLSNYGYCSRKEVRRLIEEKRIIVNGKLCEQGQWVEESDDILLDGEKVEKKEKIYLALNKPRGIVCTSSREIKDNIIDFLNYKDYVFPVGRLDKDSQGLILMTNDGDIANKILSSENYHEKEYIVTLDKDFDDEFIYKMSNGVNILDTVTRPCKVTRINNNTFNIILTQGLNRQIRRMCKTLGYNVIKLERIRIVNVLSEGIEIGRWRKLTKEEIEELKLIDINL